MSNRLTVAFTFVLFCLVRHASSERILGLMGGSSLSYHRWYEVIYDGLAKRGHKLTIVSLSKDGPSNANISYIHLEKGYNIINDLNKNLDTTKSAFEKPLTNLRLFYDNQVAACEGIIQSEGFQEALKLRNHFDLILYDVSSGPCLLRLIEHFPATPVVGITAGKITPNLLGILGGYSYPASVPLLFNDMGVPTTSWQRLYNTASYIIDYWYRTYVTDSAIDAMVSEYFPESNLRLSVLYDRIAVILVNSHPALDYAQSLPPNIIAVAGLGIKKSNPVPKDIYKFIETAEKGGSLIYLGPNVNLSSIGEKRLQMFVKVIERLSKFNFLWQVEDAHLVKTAPKNLIIRKELPIDDILAHPRLRGVVSNTDSFTFQKASWYGLPITAIPFTIDDSYNAHHIQQIGCGLYVNLETLTEKALFRGVLGVHTDEAYRSKMVEIQSLLRGQGVNPLDTAVWWIEFVLNNVKAERITPASRNQSYFIGNSLDIIFATVLVLVLVFIVSLWVGVKVLQKMNDVDKIKNRKSIVKLKTSRLKKKKNN